MSKLKRDHISFICFMVLSIPLLIYFFSGGLIVHAEEAVPTSTPVPVPDGYNTLSSYGYPDIGNHIITAEGYLSSSIYSEFGKASSVLASSENNEGISSDFYDGDMSNGELVINNDIFFTVNLGNRDSQGFDIDEPFAFDFTTSDFWYLSNPSPNNYTLTCVQHIRTMPVSSLLVLDNGINVFSTVASFPQWVNTYGNYSSLDYCVVGIYSGTYDSSGDYPIIKLDKFNSYKTDQSVAFNSGSNNNYGEPIYNYFGSNSIGSNPNIYYCTDHIFTVPNGSNVNDVLTARGYNSSGDDIGSVTLFDVNYGGSVEESTVYPDGSGGDITNNMYLESADWKFNIPKYWGNVTSSLVQPKYTANWGSGSVSFYAICNDFLQDNADQYKLVFNFYVKCNGHRFSDTHSEIDENFAKSFAWRSVEYDLADYLTNKSINVDFPVHDIFTSAWDQGMSINVTNFIEELKTYNSIDNWDWSLSCDAQLVSGSYTSGSIQENYNFISQVSKEVSNTITQNNNPYYPEDENGKPIIPDKDNSSSSTDKYGNVTFTNNNNPVINNNVNVNSNIDNVNGSNGNPFNTLIDKIFGDGTVSEGSIGGNTADKLLTVTGASKWFAVMNDSFSFVPASVWVELTVFLGVVLSIMAVAFILRIILDFL